MFSSFYLSFFLARGGGRGACFSGEKGLGFRPIMG